MLFSNSIASLGGDVLLKNTTIKMVEELKFLGLFIDNKLSWKPQTVYLNNLLSRNVGVINKLKSMFPSHILLLLLYSTLVLPYINYGILAWGNSSKSQLDRLSITQKRVMRIIGNKPRLTPSNKIVLFENKVLKLNYLFYYQLGCLMYQARVHELPQVLQSMFRNKMIEYTIILLANLLHRFSFTPSTYSPCSKYIDFTLDLFIGTTLTQIFSKLAHLNLLNEILKFI